MMNLEMSHIETNAKKRFRDLTKHFLVQVDDRINKEEICEHLVKFLLSRLLIPIGGMRMYNIRNLGAKALILSVLRSLIQSQEQMLFYSLVLPKAF